MYTYAVSVLKSHVRYKILQEIVKISNKVNYNLQKRLLIIYITIVMASLVQSGVYQCITLKNTTILPPSSFYCIKNCNMK
jgi:uncharacterized membrane protein YwzB